ncbi:MAG: Flagellar assembly protein FliH [Proteobacteria bacterium]|nr:Flagellar assembly protein FliH [Pseudomonadota bacterium]
MSGIIPKDQLANCQPWQIGSFDRKPMPQGAPSSAPAPTVQPPAGEAVALPVLPTAEEIEKIYEEARGSGYQAGFDEGRVAGEQAGRESVQLEAERISALVSNLQKALRDVDQTVAEQLLDLALEVAAQLTRGSIKADNAALLPIVREAIAALSIHHTHITVHLNPTDAALVRARIGEQLTQSGSQIIEDAEITRGGCLVKAGASEVDATIETRWKRVLEAIGVEPQNWLEPA